MNLYKSAKTHLNFRKVIMEEENIPGGHHFRVVPCQGSQPCALYMRPQFSVPKNELKEELGLSRKLIRDNSFGVFGQPSFLSFLKLDRLSPGNLAPPMDLFGKSSVFHNEESLGLWFRHLSFGDMIIKFRFHDLTSENEFCQIKALK